MAFCSELKNPKEQLGQLWQIQHSCHLTSTSDAALVSDMVYYGRKTAMKITNQLRCKLIWQIISGPHSNQNKQIFFACCNYHLYWLCYNLVANLEIRIRQTPGNHLWRISDIRTNGHKGKKKSTVHRFLAKQILLKEEFTFLHYRVKLSVIALTGNL